LDYEAVYGGGTYNLKLSMLTLIYQV